MSDKTVNEIDLDEKAAILAASDYAKSKQLRDPYRAYYAQMKNAGLRGIEWNFNFSEWWSIWMPVYHLRGTGKNGLCMARHGDKGDYSPNNVYITTNLGNLIDSHKSEAAVNRRKQKKESREIYSARSSLSKRVRRLELKSQLSFGKVQTNKYACNQTEDPV